MRNIIFAVLLGIMTGCAFAEETDGVDLNLVRVPILNGIYTVEAPSEWHLEISGDDLTATFAEAPDADGVLIISAPNPAVNDIREYTQLATRDIFESFGGEIIQEKEEEIDGFPVHTLWFSTTINGTEFLGWGRTIDFNGVAVQGVALSTAARFVEYMQVAAPIFDSYELNSEMVEENIDLFREIGGKVLENLKRSSNSTEAVEATPAA